MMRGGVTAGMLAVVLATAGCGGGEVAAATGVGAMLERLPACAEPAGGAAHDLPLPSQVTLTTFSREPQVTGAGYAAGLPGDVVDAVAAQPGIEVLWSEDEGFEAEILLEQDGERVFLQAMATCQGGSSVEVRSVAMQ